MPAHEVPALRQFIFSPMRTMFRGGGRRPKPFDTYHTAGDSGATLDATALDRMVNALAAVVETRAAQLSARPPLDVQRVRLSRRPSAPPRIWTF